MRLKNKLFFGKDLAEWKIVSTFALAFEKSSITRSNIKKEFFERFYINRQVVQEAVKFVEIRKLTGLKKRTVKQLTSQVY